jgi:hypothetical protein
MPHKLQLSCVYNNARFRVQHMQPALHPGANTIVKTLVGATVSKCLGQGPICKRLTSSKRHKYCRNLSLLTLPLHPGLVFSYYPNKVLYRSSITIWVPGAHWDMSCDPPNNAGELNSSRMTNQSQRSISGRRHQDFTNGHVCRNLSRMSCPRRICVRLADMP